MAMRDRSSGDGAIGEFGTSRATVGGMNEWALVLAIACAVGNGFAIQGGRRALQVSGDAPEARATAWYMIARSAGITIGALTGGLGILVDWPGQVIGWVMAVAVITSAVQLFDVPVWLLRRKFWWAAGSLGMALAILLLGVIVIRQV